MNHIYTVNTVMFVGFVFLSGSRLQNFGKVVCMKENVAQEKRTVFVNHASAHSNFLLELKAKVLLFPISDPKKQQKGAATLKGHSVYAQIFAAAALLY